MRNGRQRHYERSTLRMSNPDAEEISSLLDKTGTEARVRIFAENALPAIKDGRVEIYDPVKKYSQKDEGKVCRRPENYEGWPAQFPTMLLWSASASKRVDFIAADGMLYSFTKGTKQSPSVRLNVKNQNAGYINEVL